MPVWRLQRTLPRWCRGGGGQCQWGSANVGAAAAPLHRLTGVQSFLLLSPLPPPPGTWLRTQGGGGNTGKCSTWEGGHRVVGAARWPGKIPAGSVSDALTSTLDFLPTIANLAGVKLHTDRYYDGIDIGPVLFDGATEAHTTLFHPNNCEGKNGDIDTIRVRQYKAKVPGGGGGGGWWPRGDSSPLLDRAR